MTGKKLLKMLLDDGWELERIHGSHHIIKKGNKTEIIAIHSNKDIPNGLLNKILKRTGLK